MFTKRILLNGFQPVNVCFTDKDDLCLRNLRAVIIRKLFLHLICSEFMYFIKRVKFYLRVNIVYLTNFLTNK